ncbi:hypothetical protein [Longimicrobium sp.]|uniref:hypothetical protein n=1 Tax=Longimicrobium sp. TaxID=2029185 RepID=UPI002EDA0BC6
MHIDGSGVTASGAVLGVVIAARLTENGAHIVVLDAVPPHVKVFDRSGTLRHSFLGQGGGPGEARFPVTLATSGDTAILVADGQRRVQQFDLAGKLQHVFTADFLPLAAGEACGEWRLYGPRVQGAGAAPLWLHRVRFAHGRPEVQSLYRDSMPASGIAMGTPYGFIAHHQGTLVRHNLATVPLLLEWPCGDSGPHSVSIPDPFRAPPPTLQRGPGAAHVKPGARAQAGIATMRNGLVLADLVHSGANDGYTDLLLMQDGSHARASVPGAVTLRDSKPGVGVLIHTEEPEPQVFLVSEQEFLRMFGRQSARR